MLNTVFSFIVAISVLVFLHELGHYLVARWCGVSVVQFSVGFGRPLVEWKNKKTGVLWSIGWIPMGGFVRMLDERDPESIQTSQAENLDRAFNRQSVYKRIAIVLAGPVANLLVAWVLYTGLIVAQDTKLAPEVAPPVEGTIAHQLGLRGGDRIVSINGEQTPEWRLITWQLLNARLFDEGLRLEVLRGGQTFNPPALPAQAVADLAFSGNLAAEGGFRPYEKRVFVGSVQPGSAAEQAGFQVQDTLLAVNGQPVVSAAGFIQVISQQANKEVLLEVKRAGDLIQLQATPKPVQPEQGPPIGRLGIALAVDRVIEQFDVGFGQALMQGADRVFEISVLSVATLTNMITGDVSWTNLSGPVSIASVAGQTSSLGLIPFLGFLALLSVSLGILNLLPIPVLDGGHLMYYLAEIIFRRPVSEFWMGVGQKVGLALIGTLMVVAIFNDIHRLFL